MKTRIWQAVLAAVAIAVAAALVWLNQDRLFGRMTLPADSLAFAEQITAIRAGQRWGNVADYRRKLTRAILLRSQELGCAFLLNNQRPEGNFNYEYDFVTQKQSKDDNQVRQAGALWGVALCHQFAPSDKTRAALDKGLGFFFRNTRPGPDDSLLFNYPGQKTVETGAVALASLAIIEYLRAEPEMDAERRAALESKLDGYLRFVRTMQMPAGDFHLGVTRGVNVKIGRTSPYFDGEAQLALVKAIRYTGRAEFLPVLQRAVEKNAPKYTVEAWRKARDSDDTKSFYQWGTMSLCEYVDAGFPNAPTYADAVLALAWWQLYTHKTLMKTRNSAYAFEGLVHAYRLAKSQGDARAAADLARTIDKGLYRLTSWQVGGPLAERNSFLRGHPTSDPLAIGGVMNERNKAPLRIDVAQHQMHAVILALKTIYTE